MIKAAQKLLRQANDNNKHEIGSALLSENTSIYYKKLAAQTLSNDNLWSQPFIVIATFWLTEQEHFKISTTKMFVASWNFFVGSDKIQPVVENIEN